MEDYNPAIDRQMGTNYDEIRPDHTYRYGYAIEQAMGTFGGQISVRALDLCAGIGYGSHLMAANNFLVDAVEISEDAKKCHEDHWTHDNVSYHNMDAHRFLMEAEDESYDLVTFLEALEHFENPDEIMQQIHRVLKPKGMLVISAPNQVVQPFDAQNFVGQKYPHYRHYSPTTLTSYVNGFNLLVTHWGAQYDKQSEIHHADNLGVDAMFLVYTARKPLVRE